MAYSDDNNGCKDTITSCNDYNSLWSSTTFCLETSITYWIFVSSYSGSSVGDFTLIIEELDSCIPPSNDVCPQALTINQLSSTLSIDVTDAKGGASSCGDVSEGDHSVWYQLIGNGKYFSVSTCSPITNFQTSLMVFTG